MNLSNIKALILNMDGVLWRENMPIGDLPAIFTCIRQRGFKVALATNNATRTIEEHLAKLSNFGVTLEPWEQLTVYVEEERHQLPADYRFALRGSGELVATSRRTIFFPFWSIPLQTETGSYEIVVEGIAGAIVAWRLPRIYQASTLNWAVLAVPGALALGQFLRATLFGSSILNPAIGLVAGIVALGTALWRSNRPDWSVQTWPDAATIVRLEQHGR